MQVFKIRINKKDLAFFQLNLIAFLANASLRF